MGKIITPKMLAPGIAPSSLVQYPIFGGPSDPTATLQLPGERFLYRLFSLSFPYTNNTLSYIAGRIRLVDGANNVLGEWLTTYNSGVGVTDLFFGFYPNAARATFNLGSFGPLIDRITGYIPPDLWVPPSCRVQVFALGADSGGSGVDVWGQISVGRLAV